uniref:ZP domain-containing protein n=1 Tax=Ciona savignyi TaxID=51511 RepID=H2YH39_CIOSA
MFMQFSCSYALNLNMTLGAPLTPTNRDVKIDSGIAEGKFVIDLKLWEANYTVTPYISPNAVVANDFIYVTVDAKTADPGRFKLQVTSAKATPTSSPTDPISYPLLVGGCSNPAEVLPDGIVVDTNGAGLEGKFKFRVFQFLNLSPGQPQLVYIHVEAHLCDQVLEGNCNISCPGGLSGRRRRGLHFNSDNTILASSQPIYVQKRKKRDDDDINSNKKGIQGAFTWAKGSWLALTVVILIIVLIVVLLSALCVLIYRSSRNVPQDFKPLIENPSYRKDNA